MPPPSTKHGNKSPVIVNINKYLHIYKHKSWETLPTIYIYSLSITLSQLTAAKSGTRSTITLAWFSSTPCSGVPRSRPRRRRKFAGIALGAGPAWRIVPSAAGWWTRRTSAALSPWPEACFQKSDQLWSTTPGCSPRKLSLRIETCPATRKIILLKSHSWVSLIRSLFLLVIDEWES